MNFALKILQTVSSLMGYTDAIQTYGPWVIKKAREWWMGKKIAVIGATASGKDSFLARLEGRSVPDVHTNTGVAERVRSFRVSFALSDGRRVDFKCKGVINTGGETDYRDSQFGWSDVCQGADVIFYLMTIEDLLENRFKKGHRVRDDIDWLLSALPKVSSTALVHILINKIDLRLEDHAEWRNLDQEVRQHLTELEKEVRSALHPYSDRYSGATLISMNNTQMYTRGMERALQAVYKAVHPEVKG